MAQYLEITGTSFGNAHGDDPTYAFTIGSGDIFLSGSGGYVNSPTGITKAVLTSGVKLKISDDTATAVTCSVENGFTCAGEFEYATWTLTSPTPSATPATSTVTIDLSSIQELGTWPEYTIGITINGCKAVLRTIQQTDSNPAQDTFDLIQTGTVDGGGTITVSRTLPDNTCVDATSIQIGQGNGHTTSPTFRNYTTGQTIDNASFIVSGFTFGEEIDISIVEG